MVKNMLFVEVANFICTRSAKHTFHADMLLGKNKCEAKGLDPEEMVKYIEYKSLRYHSSYGGGGYEKTISYNTVEEFNKLWAMFQMGYKDAEMRNKLNNIKEDF